MTLKNDENRGNAGENAGGIMKFKLDNSFDDNLALFKAESEKIDPEFDCEIDFSRKDSGFETSTESSLVTFLEDITQKKAGSVAFGTEGAQMTRLGSEAVVLGPGDIRQAHRTGEFVPIDELERCVEILKKAVEHFCC